MMRKLRGQWREFISLLVGVPSYEKYVAYMKEKQPSQPILSRKAFFADVQKAKFETKAGNVSRCC
ncbi:CstA-like transporter-associated (seleno)protein [Ectobacillus sp. JY-23]|uniref:YbdD/YjiX family protein n=1 Tax=Ectobacillus sp. JY-23 TaxID=2933872 RepID=UPI001FF4684C|nr:YbdD/YjiX family protein [Ectobacillus sp. JY-23]UOY94544.1 CstA-like transporter-associated (seleno)protein [Ectobacillus sp. JY-23]